MLQQLLKENQDLKDRLDTIKESSEKVIKDVENLQSKSNSDKDDYAMAFAEWRLTTLIKNADEYTMRELLEIFKKEKGL